MEADSRGIHPAELRTRELDRQLRERLHRVIEEDHQKLLTRRLTEQMRKQHVALCSEPSDMEKVLPAGRTHAAP